MKKYICLLIFLISHYFLSAQNIHFSQMFATDVFLNPANTGNFQGNWRINNIYREQGNNFNAPYKTVMVGFDKHFYTNGKQISGGIYFLNDMSAQNSLMVNKLFFTGAYHVNISQKMKLRFGMQAGVVQKSNNTGNLTLPEQFDISTGQFNSGLPNSEIYSQDNIQYLDLGSGILGQYRMNETEYEMGVAAFQLNKPRESFMNENKDIPIKTIFHGSVKKKWDRNLYWKPSFYYSFLKNASELVIGSQAIYMLRNWPRKSEFYVAFYLRGGIKRNSDAAIIAVGLVHLNWNFCFSYDYDISGLHGITSRSNAFEVSIIYIRPETIIKERTEPCMLY